ncbi:MAG: HD domain-containing protein [Candidatus Riflebacteria bacterium]|nr:HD domain-containing protein [Candidatus Riflebacteria bacterium]
MPESLEERFVSIVRDRLRGREPAHDFLHVVRVVETGRTIARSEAADPGVVIPAALLHELFNYPKGHPEAHLSGEVCARQAAAVLEAQGCPRDLIDRVTYCVTVHGFSTGIVPRTLEAKVLQDADRLDAIGAIGVARCFATTSSMGRPFYDLEDPFCRVREPDDRRFGLDHFYRKLLEIPGRLHTATARRLAEGRSRFLHDFLQRLEDEIGQRSVPP